MSISDFEECRGRRRTRHQRRTISRHVFVEKRPYLTEIYVAMWGIGKSSFTPSTPGPKRRWGPARTTLPVGVVNDVVHEFRQLTTLREERLRCYFARSHRKATQLYQVRSRPMELGKTPATEPKVTRLNPAQTRHCVPLNRASLRNSRLAVQDDRRRWCAFRDSRNRTRRLPDRFRKGHLMVIESPRSRFVCVCVCVCASAKRFLVGFRVKSTTE